MYGGKDEGVYMDSTYNLFYPKGSLNLKACGEWGGGWEGERTVSLHRFENITSFKVFTGILDFTNA
jgi:hypothetical protein